MSEKDETTREEMGEDAQELLALYRRTRKPLPWDEADDNVLEYARSKLTNQVPPNTETPEEKASQPPASESVVNIPSIGRTKHAARLARSDADAGSAGSKREWTLRPWAGSLALAASLAMGIIIGTIPQWVGVQAPTHSRTTSPKPGMQHEPIYRGATDDESPGGPLKPFLHSYTCSALYSEFNEAGPLMVSGFVPSEIHLADLTHFLSEAVTPARVVLDVAVVPPPLCQVLEEITRSTWFLAPSELSPGIEIVRSDAQTGIEVTAPSTVPLHLSVSVLNRDGTIIHLHDGTSPSAPSTILSFDLSEVSNSSLARDGIVLVLASRKALFADPRPNQETVASYLADLRSVAQNRLRSGEFLITRYRVLDIEPL